MLGHRPFYHRTIRKYVVLFGALFNDLFYVRETAAGLPKERQKVILSYAPKEKFITRLRSDPTLTKSIATTLPRMSFEMTSMTYDAARKQESLIRHRRHNSANTAHPYAQYMGVPYDFTFGLSIYARNIEDGIQIVEQILPFFTPDYTVSATVSEEVALVKDIPIILNSVTEKIDYEGSFENGTRIAMWDLEFTLKGYLFGPVSNTAIIKGNAGNTITGGVYANLYEDVNNKTLQKVIVTGGGNTQFQLAEPIRETNHNITGTVYFWSNTSNTLLLSGMTGVLKANDEIWGLNSGAHWSVLSVEVTPLKAAEIHIYQNPITATAEDDYGYTTILTEYPDTI